MSDISERVRAVVARELQLTTLIVENDATLRSLGADSLDGIGLIMALEMEFGRTFPKQAFSTLDAAQDEATFAAFLGCIEEALHEQHGISAP